MVGPPPKPSDQPAPLLRRQRRENRPVHDSTMPLILSFNLLVRAVL
jgi:hypothetical protein